MIDQADKLRHIINENNQLHPIKIYSVVSGKGGVGKTNFSINLGIKLYQLGKRVLIIDADVGMTNANIMLGINTPRNLGELLEGKFTLDEIIIKGSEGLDLISGGSDIFLMERLDPDRQRDFLKSLEQLERYDVIIIDNGAGINKYSLTFSSFAHEVILITTPEPTALMDAYRILKVTSFHGLKDRVKVVINQAKDQAQAKNAYDKLLFTSKEFLSLELENLGFIYNDIRVKKSIMEQVPLVIKYPTSLASQNIMEISRNIIEDKAYNREVSNFKQLKNKILRFFG